MAIRRKVYRRMSDKRLRELRSEKVLELHRIGAHKGYWNKGDTLRLTEQIIAIDAECACRLLQIKLI